MTHISISDSDPALADRPPFSQFLEQEGILFLSGAVGSQLARRGLPHQDDAGLPAIASQVAPELLTQIHAEYAAAGANVLTVDTFDLSPWRQGKQGRAENAGLAIAAAYDAARKVREAHPDRPVYLAGSLTSLNDCYDPGATPDDATLAREHFRQVALHAANNPDLLCIETIPSLREAVALANAAGAHSLPYIISFTVGEDGNLLDGTPIEEAARATNLPGRIGIGVNCCQIEAAQNSTARLNALFNQSAGRKGQRIAAYPNGYAHSRDAFCAENGEKPEARHTHDCERKKKTVSANDFAQVAKGLRHAGATIIGGCCGTDPSHTAAYVRALGGAQRRLMAA